MGPDRSAGSCRIAGAVLLEEGLVVSVWEEQVHGWEARVEVLVHSVGTVGA